MVTLKTFAAEHKFVQNVDKNIMTKNVTIIHTAQIVMAITLPTTERAHIGKKKKEILTIKVTKNISFADARKEVERLAPDPSRNSYANVTQNQQPWSGTIRPPTDFQTEPLYLRYLVDYCLNRLRNLERINTATQENPVASTSTNNTTTSQKQRTHTGPTKTPEAHRGAEREENKTFIQFDTESLILLQYT